MAEGKHQGELADSRGVAGGGGGGGGEQGLLGKEPN